MVIDQGNVKSRHFKLDRLADGVYAAIQLEGGWGIANAGIVDLGDRTLIFDSMMTPHAASDLRSSAEALTGRPVYAVVNSHFHNDHIWGNPAFSEETEFIATNEIRELISIKGKEELRYFKEISKARLLELETRQATASEPVDVEELSVWIPYYQGILAALPGLKLRLPRLTFSERMVLHGSERTVELLTYGGGHTGDDVLLYLPDDGIVFMGDLMFVGSHPYMVGGDPDKLLKTLDAVHALKAEIFVPGHGPVGDIHDFELNQRYVHHLGEVIAGVVGRGEDEDALSHIQIPEPFDGWHTPVNFKNNLEFLYQRYIQ
jgi:glyoxylase-like metal-dependent hydrolase (beta-lactamase superfamily II)